MATLVLLFGTPARAIAQGILFGAGVGVGSVPRSLSPLCGSARRLNGPTVSAQAGLFVKRLRVSTGVDYTARGYTEVASCVPRAGISVDSIFAPARSSVMTVAGEVSFPATRQLSVSVGAGLVPSHRSWFISGGAGSQYRNIRAEIAARWHRISYDELTREFTGQGVRQISRSSHTEDSWGGIVRLLLVTR